MAADRRSQFLHLLGLAIFLIAAIQICPVFFLATLGVLLLVSRPRSLREWLWIALCAGALAAWFQLPGTLSQHAVRAAGVFYAGAFAVLTLAQVRSLFSRAMLSLLIGALAMTGWFVALHLRFADLQSDFISQTWSAWHQLFSSLPTLPPPPGAAGSVTGGAPDLASEVASSVNTMAAVYPALMAMAALLGTWLAWYWYARIARAPLGVPAPALRMFRFNDQLVWLLVVAIAGTLLPASPAIALVTENVLLVVLAAYALRGLAVATTALRHATPLFVGVMVLIMVPMFAFAATGLTLLGVADTWLDFRRRMAPPSGVV